MSGSVAGAEEGILLPTVTRCEVNKASNKEKSLCLIYL